MLFGLVGVGYAALRGMRKGPVVCRRVGRLATLMRAKDRLRANPAAVRGSTTPRPSPRVLASAGRDLALGGQSGSPCARDQVTMDFDRGAASIGRKGEASTW